ncbi:dolichyl-phosphate beta-D-mannosyltransferase [Methanoculleus taiwanensis]|uniref:Dolichyl-phosphate beta-D-mannosyltransferase n=1 Tax=Methanoculleus taiwanensis TaxID=1550565 RepID=A0A498GZ69_9EURY|nr:glycosyltransferase family 2 protein [Methanoculleus taiwanensis]RXE55414.1 dolichyl-phosphate beta-D-mannosyltransferase [Methanoculleus taiwanensis]
MNTDYDLSVIIPTFNEEENIAAIVEAVDDVLTASGLRGEILIVDDNSRDGTIGIAEGLAARKTNVRLIVRMHDHGLSQSVVDGFSHARSGIFQVIDADFSHPPELIPSFYEAIQRSNDVAIGSRYMKGGSIEAWPLKRRIISLGATAFGRALFPDITDPVSGFFAVRRSVVADAPLKPRGYKILMEVLGKGRWDSFVEIPFVFKDREEGESKLKPATILDYLKQCSDIAFFSLRHRNGAVWHEWKKIFSFGLVGISGILVNMGLLYLLTEYAGLYYLLSALIAIELSIMNNFFWNDVWTFKSPKNLRLERKLHRFASFQFVAIGGLLINLTVLYVLTEIAGVYYLLANLAGILIAFAWNYMVNRHYTWKSA